MLAVPSDHDFSAEVGGVGLRIIDSDDVAIGDQGTHGLALGADAGSLRGIGAPREWGSEHLFRGDLIEIGLLVAGFAARGGLNGEQGDGHQLGLRRYFLPTFAAAGNDHINVRGFCAREGDAALREQAGQIRAFQPSARPKHPTIGLAGKISKLNVALRGRFLRSAFPAGDGHGGVMQTRAKGCLAQSQTLPELLNLASPLGYRSFASCHWFRTRTKWDFARERDPKPRSKASPTVTN